MNPTTVPFDQQIEEIGKNSAEERLTKSINSINILRKPISKKERARRKKKRQVARESKRRNR